MKNRKWIIVFAVLAMLGGLAVGINWIFAANQLLTPEKLAAARAQWERQHPASYDLKITVTTIPASIDGPGRTNVNIYTVQVRNNRITSFLMNGQNPDPILDAQNKRNLTAERERQEYYDIPGWFDALDDFLEKDQREGVKPFNRARFDKKDGHLMNFTRQTKVGSFRATLNVKIEMTLAADETAP